MTLLVACSKAPAPPDLSASAGPRAVTFVNRVWEVSASNTVAPGQLYVFLSEGTLVIASSTGTPAFGSWKEDASGLTMIEEGIPHHVRILRLSAEEFRLAIDSPGEPVEMTLV